MLRLVQIKHFLRLSTFFILIWGVFSLKAYLKENFIEKDTKTKETINKALNADFK